MATLEIGIRIDPVHGLAYFGVEEINRRVAAGARVLEIRPGGAVTTKLGDAEGDAVRLTLSGCQFQVLLEDA